MPFALYLLISAALTAAPEKQSADADQDKADAAAVSDLAKDEAAGWEFVKDNDARTKLKLHSQPVLRWSNPDAGRVYGDVLLWTDRGRPEVIVSYYRWFSPYQSFNAELKSLSTSGIRGLRKEKEVWHAETSDTAVKPVPNAPAPAGTSRERLRQLRDIAREFSAELTDTRSDDKGQFQRLRLLTQPIHRYEAPEIGITDGALFAFVLGTDPEVFLLVETRRDENKDTWHFALARMNTDAVRVLHQDREVWSVPSLGRKLGLRSDPYYTVIITPPDKRGK